MWKNLIISALLLLFICYLSGCIQHYASANLGAAMTYAPAPAYRGSDTTATYVGGSYGSTFNNGAYDTDDKIDIGQVMVHRAKVGQNYTFVYGGLGHFGNYTARYNTIDPNLQLRADSINGNKNFWGLGAFTELNLAISSETFDYRILGMQVAVYYEGGQYFDYRKVLDNLGSTTNLGFDEVNNLHTSNWTYGLGFNSEFIIKTDHADIGARADFGYIKGGREANVIGGLKFYITRNRWTFSTQLSGAVDMEGGLTSFGLNYRIK